MTTKLIVSTALILVAVFSSCSNEKARDSETKDTEAITNKETNNMQNLISIIEIPTSDLQRAIAFYNSILAVNIEEAEMGDVKMGILPGGEGTVSVVLANGVDYKPTSDGSVIYLNGGANLQTILDKVEPSGGKVIVPKTEISPEMGFFALFIDSEGNKLGLHSAK
jgi:predicted enzyme related to lactoylglutathione lyase